MNAAPVTSAHAAAVETPIVFALGRDELVGVLTAPADTARATALLIVVGGPQVRVGSHRQFVQLARHVAAHGHAALRFDVRGMGDSSGEAAGFEQLDADIDAAITALLNQCPELRRVVLWGLCDGASASLMYLQRKPDPRVAGLVLLNPWVRSEQTLAKARVRHYYLQRLAQPSFWRKLVGGGVGAAALRDGWRNLRAARSGPGSTARARSDEAGNADAALPFQQRMARGWRACRGPILLLLSGDDVTAQEFAVHAGSDPGWRGALAEARVTRVDLPGVDHTLSVPGAAARVAETTLDWLRRLDAQAAR